MIKRHRSPRTDELTRQEMQTRKASIRTIARELGISPTTVQKWRKRATTADLPMGPKTPRPSALTPVDEALIVLFRWTSHLSLDDCMRALAPAIPHLRRSTLYRALKRYGLAEAPLGGDGTHGDPSLGNFRVACTELRTAIGSLGLFMAVDAASRFTVVKMHVGTHPIADLVAKLSAAVPYPVCSILWQTWSRPVDAGQALDPTQSCPVGDEPTTAFLSQRLALSRSQGFSDEEIIETSSWRNCVVPEIARTVIAGFETLLKRDLAEAEMKIESVVANFNRRTSLRCLGGLSPMKFSLAAQLGRNVP
ncbi:MAG TPA: helix-turn-helix domain-containing protein [Aliidongia sp.]|nr:helix-turn-helix domain-containing protein [Aliidongia sp.]